MERRFDEALQELKKQMLTMAGQVEQAVGKGVRALADRDAALARAVIREDAEINRLEIDTENACLGLVARFQPEAKDLRLVMMVFKIVNDLERVGDQAVNIGERTLDLLKSPPLKPLTRIPKVAQLSQAMLKDALDAFVNRNADLAREVCRRDNEVDDLNRQIHEELIGYMTGGPENVQRALDLILVSRHLERVADHATNIAEDVFYMIRGVHIQHHLAGE